MQNVQEITSTPLPPPVLRSRAQETLELMNSMPAASEILLHNQTWEDYEDLMDVVIDRPRFHIAFDGETIQIMTLSLSHDRTVRLLDALIRALSMASGIDVDNIGSTTIKQADVMRGLEPDSSFYVQNIDAITGRSQLDFTVDPVPDLAIEIDFYNSSLRKFPIFAALGFPEIWRYSDGTLEFFKLEAGAYLPIEKSIALPMLTPDLLTPFLKRAPTERQNAIIRDFEDGMRNHKI